MYLSFDELYERVYDQKVLPHVHIPTYGGSQVYEEFNSCWEFLTTLFDLDNKEVTFLEIGAFKGLWGLRLLYECSFKGLKSIYHTVTLIDQDRNNNSLYKIKDIYEMQDNMEMLLIDNDSTDPKNLEKLNKKYDFVFIDANHTYEYVMKDIELYKDLATKALIFHDIRPHIPTQNCGVFQAIQDSGLQLTHEFVVRRDIMGIGIIKL